MARTLVWGYPNYPGAAPEDCLSWLDHSLRDGTRVVADAHGDGVALAFNEFVPDQWTRNLWHLNDVITPGQWCIADAGYEPRTLRAESAAYSADGWLDRCGAKDVQSGDLATGNTSSPIANGTDRCIEAWVYIKPPASNLGYNFIFQAGNRYFALEAETYNNYRRVRFWYCNAAETWTGYGIFDYNEWMHLAGSVDHASGKVRIFVNGVLQREADIVSDTTVSSYPQALFSNLAGMIDEVRVSIGTPRYTSNFSPHRYEAGAITAQYTLPSQYRLTAIDWDGLLGASYGLVTKVEVYSGGWKTVAEDANGVTPPLTGLNYIVAGPDIVRLTLQPKQDTLQSETPVLDWLLANLEPIGQPLPKQVTIDARATAVLIDGTPSSVVVDARKRGVRG